MRDPILITGCARSGTSLVAGTLSICGAWGGTTCGPTRHNKKGQFENVPVRNTLIKPYLRHINCDPLGQRPLPVMKDLIPFPALREQMQEIFRMQGFTGDKPWYFKGAKMCLLWPIFKTAFPDAKWVIVRRADEDIINSCLHTGFMKAYKDASGWQSWVDTHKMRFQEMINSMPDQVKSIWPATFIKGDLEPVKGLVEWLGLEWNDSAVKDFIAPELWGKRGA